MIESIIKIQGAVDWVINDLKYKAPEQMTAELHSSHTSHLIEVITGEIQNLHDFCNARIFFDDEQTAYLKQLLYYERERIHRIFEKRPKASPIYSKAGVITSILNALEE